MHCQVTRANLRSSKLQKIHKTIENVSVFNTAIKFDPLSTKLNLDSRVSINVQKKFKKFETQNIGSSPFYVKMSSELLTISIDYSFFWWNMAFDDEIALRTFSVWIFFWWFYFIKKMTVYLLCMCKQIPFSDVINSQQRQPKISMQYIGFEKLIEQWIECAPHA